MPDLDERKPWRGIAGAAAEGKLRGKGCWVPPGSARVLSERTCDDRLEERRRERESRFCPDVCRVYGRE